MSALRSALSDKSQEEYKITSAKVHRILAEGNLILSVSEGLLDSQHCSFYDLFRFAKGNIIEHSDTIEPIPPKTEWKNNNGKF